MTVPRGDQWPLGSGKTMSFTFQEAGVKNVRVTVTDADGDTATTMKAITVGAAAPPADTTAPDTTISSGPSGTSTDNTPTFAFTVERERIDVPVPARLGGVGELHQPLDDGALARRPAQRLRPRHRRCRQRRRDAGHAGVHGRPRRPRPTPRAPDTTIGSGPTGPTNDTTPTFAFTASESGSTFQCHVDTGSWATCTSPWTTTATGQRRPQRLGPRDRRGREHRRLAGDALVHRRHVGPEHDDQLGAPRPVAWLERDA